MSRQEVEGKYKRNGDKGIHVATYEELKVESLS